MAIKLYDAATHDGLFDVQGKAFYALAALNTARATSIPPEVVDFLAQFRLLANSTQLDMAAAMEGLPSATASWQGVGNTLAGQIERIGSTCSLQACTHLALTSSAPGRTILWCGIWRCLANAHSTAF